MNAAQVAALYAAMLDAERTHRRRPSSLTLSDVKEARRQYLAARDHHRGQSLAEVTTRSANRDRLDPQVIEMFPQDPTATPRATTPEAPTFDLFGTGRK